MPPIDYSRFDKIGSDDEEDAPAGGADRARLNEALQQCLQQIGKQNGTERGEPAAASLPSMSRGRALLGGDEAADPFGRSLGVGGAPGPDLFAAGASRGLELAALRKEAWRLLVSRLVVRPGAAGATRALLLEAELHLVACRYRQALVASLALGLATSREQPGAGPPEEWAVPAMVVEMVAAYQLGDREHAIATRDRLKALDGPCPTLSQHLRKRFEGTSEILDLVPHFLNMLQASSSAEQCGGGG